MKFAVRSRTAPAAPGVHGAARVERRIPSLLGRIRPGDVVVCDHLDLDRATAQALVDAGIVGLVNAGPMISGRYPNLGPQVLVEAGISVIDQVGPEVFVRLKEGASVRLDDGSILCGSEVVATGREFDEDVVLGEMDLARRGLTAQLESFTHNSTEFLRREQDLLLHGHGVPQTATPLEGRPVVVVVRSHEWERELRGIRQFIREQDPVLIGVDRGADALAASGHRPDVVVVSAGEEPPAAQVLRKARDVVVRTDRGSGKGVTEHYERMSIRPLRFETGATAEDAALLLASNAGCALIVGVGMHATLDEFLDRQRPGLASTFLTRLKVGPTLVDASAVPVLYDGAVRPRHLLLALVAGLLAVGSAVGVTPAGQEWAADLAPALSSIIDNLRGTFS